jgi:two-component system sensor histidine kinase DegS
MDASRSNADGRQELIDLLMVETRRIRDKMGELKPQLDQTQLFVEREQKRNADIAAELRTVQDNLDTVPRADIRAKYDEAIDVRTRYTTMRAQLEKLQSMYALLQQEQAMFAQVLNRLQGVNELPAEAAQDQPAGVGRATLNIARVIQAQEEERQRLARQMHDGPAQSLTNFILQAEICQRLLDRNPDRAAEELGNLRTAAGTTFEKVRDFIFDLRPMMLDDLGVLPTIRRYVESFREKNDIEVKLDIIGDERRMPTYNEVMLFRSIQELMVQARDYSNASEIIIRVDVGGNPVRASFEDNGRGFDAEAALTSGEEHFQDPRVHALFTLREKYELIGGNLSMTSTEADGTSVKMEMPILEE